MKKYQKNNFNEEDSIRLRMQQIEEEYILLGRSVSRLVLDATRRIDGYADEIIEIKQKREEKNK